MPILLPILAFIGSMAALYGGGVFLIATMFGFSAYASRARQARSG